MDLSAKSGRAGIPQVKICGLTRPDEAAECCSLGADAIGCIFYPKSPRNISIDQAKKISLVLSPKVCLVGVFVNEPYDLIMRTATQCGLGAVQLHGQEEPDLVEKLLRQNIKVIKTVFINTPPLLENADDYKGCEYLVEHGKGPRPGGNAMEWNWEDSRAFGVDHPFILAGGLSPENIKYALNAASPDAVDISSGVEISPGRKDLKKVSLFLQIIKRSGIDKPMRKIFA